MESRGDGARVAYPLFQTGDGGSLPTSPLHFHTHQTEEAKQLVKKFHYSKRVPSNIQFVGSFHQNGGLFGTLGPMVACAIFSIPPTRWNEPVLELIRLVRIDSLKPHLSKLISLCCVYLKKAGYDLLVSFADKQYGHEGYVYRACSWNYHGCRGIGMDGLIINGTFTPGRTCNSLYGTRSPSKLKEQRPEWRIEPSYDEGKHLYWKPLTKGGEEKASRLKLTKIRWEKDL